MTTLFAVIVALMLARQFVDTRLIHWQRKLIKAQEESIRIRDEALMWERSARRGRR